MPDMFLIISLISVVSAAPAQWERTLKRVVPSVVMIRSYAPQAFDGKGAGSSYATGFVVDAERGILLTNRHVVRPGPVVAEAILQNNEEIPLQAIYRDPVHDFGFFRFDPADVEFMTLNALELKPAHARAGTDIRLIGSDSGEKISILSGTLARLDREAPVYGVGRYNDYNTFYFQAASSSSGGSSGSPVVDAYGYVVALNAGSNRRGASSYFLPLDRVVRALHLLQAGEDVTRGTIHTTFLHKTFDEVGRLGLQRATERAVRKERSEASGMLVVEKLVLGGSGDGFLEPGDVLVRADGELLIDFVSLEDILDDHVGKTVHLEVERGGEPVDLELTVGNLHDGAPDAYIETGGAVMHEYSHQLARHHRVPISGIYVAKRGYIFDRRVRAGDVIVEIDGQPVPDLDALEAALAKIPDGQDFNVRSFAPSRPHRSSVAAVPMDRQWFPTRRCTRNDTTGLWPCADLPPPDHEVKREPLSTVPLPADSKVARRYAQSFVIVHFLVPFRTDGVYGNSFAGSGVVVDAEKGLVLVDRDTVPVGLGDVTINFAMSVDVPGKIVALHPGHNLALVQYDPKLIGNTPVTAIQFDGSVLRPGDKAYMVGPSYNERIEAEPTRISNVRGLEIPLGTVPFFRDINIDLVNTQELRTGFVGGLLTDKKGRASAFWGSFPDPSDDDSSSWWRGIPASVINDFLNNHGTWRTAGVEWATVALSRARRRGLSADEAARIEAHDSSKHNVLQARRITRGGPADGMLREGDLLLGMNGEPITRLREIETRSQMPEVTLRVLRSGEVKQFTLETALEGDDQQNRLVMWAGALIQTPYKALAQQRGQPMDGVYVSYWWRGSPAGRYNLRPLRRIVAVDGVATPDLDAFVAAVLNKNHGASVRVQTVDLQGRRRTLTLKTDENYWPTEELVRTETGWERRTLNKQSTGG